MSASIRFLGLAVLAWAGVRAASLGLIPGTEAFAPAAEAATTPIPPAVAERSSRRHLPPMRRAGDRWALRPTRPTRPTPPIPAIPLIRSRSHSRYYPSAPACRARHAARPARRAGARSRRLREPLYYGAEVAGAAAGDRSLPRPRARAAARRRAATPPVRPARPAAKRFDRLQLAAWALLRGSPGPGNLASGGTLGGSQAGARLTWHFSPSLAASLRSSSLGRRRARRRGRARRSLAAAGSIPVALNLERRQALGEWGGRNALPCSPRAALYQTAGVLELPTSMLYARAASSASRAATCSSTAP